MCMSVRIIISQIKLTNHISVFIIKPMTIVLRTILSRLCHIHLTNEDVPFTCSGLANILIASVSHSVAIVCNWCSRKFCEFIRKF